jgi:hypothetical protein
MEGNQMHQYGPGNPLIFSHIPKTAGTSLHAALRTVIRPTVDVTGLDLSLFGGYDDLGSLRSTARSAVYATPEDLPADATLVAGHIAPSTTMTRYPGADHITVLRVPQVRLLSQWMHSRSLSEFDLRHWGAAAEAFRIGRRPLHEYLRHTMIAPNIDNTITRFLVWPHPLVPRLDFIRDNDDDELLDAALRRLDAFGHVNVIENADFITELGGWLGCTLPTTQLNERTYVPERMRPDFDVELDRSTRDLLDHRCRIDARVWEHVLARVRADADPVEVLEATVQRSKDRYATMPSKSHTQRPVRRAVERLYDVQARARRRR